MKCPSLLTRHSALFALAVLTLAPGAARLQAGEPAVDATNVVIGLLVPPEEPAAASLRDGSILGVEHANQCPGPRARLVIRGRTGQWGADGVEAARMVTDDGALGLIAPPDGAASHLVLQVSGRTAVPVISLCSDSSVSRTGVPWMVRVVPSTVDEAKTLFAGVRASRWVAVTPDGRAGREAAGDLRQAAAAAACSLETVIQVNTAFTNAGAACKHILATQPDAVLLWLDPATAGKLTRALRARSFSGALAGPGRLDSPAFAAAAGNAMEGFKVAAPVPERDAAAAFQQFTNAFRARFGRQPDATAAAAYDAATLLLKILGRAGDQPAHELFPLAFPFTGASGILTFDSQGNRKVNLEVFEAREGQFGLLEAAAGK